CRLSTSERVCTAIELNPRDPAGIVILRTALRTDLTKSRPVVASKTGSTFSTLNNPFECALSIANIIYLYSCTSSELYIDVIIDPTKSPKSFHDVNARLRLPS